MVDKNKILRYFFPGQKAMEVRHVELCIPLDIAFTDVIRLKFNICSIPCSARGLPELGPKWSKAQGYLPVMPELRTTATSSGLTRIPRAFALQFSFSMVSFLSHFFFSVTSPTLLVPQLK